jgi:hypothetical protein
MLPEVLSRIFRRRGEEGYALAVTLISTFVMLIVVTNTVDTGTRLNSASARDSRWNLALQVAEAGVDKTVFELSANVAFAGSGGVWSVPGGEVETTVTSPNVGWRQIVSTGYVPAKGAPGALKRRIRVTYGPWATFKYALFSDTGLVLKNNDGTVGDIFANESIVMDNNSGVTGNVISGTGSVFFNNGAKVHKNGSEGGNVYSGGYDATGLWGIYLSNNAEIAGDAFAEAETCPGEASDSGRYNISNAGVIKGNAKARGSINGAVNGTVVPFSCQVRHGRKQLPEYHYDASLYPGVTEYTSVSTFQSWVSANSANLTGTRHVWVSDCGSDPSGAANVVDLGGTTIKDGFNLITNCRIDFGLNATYSGPSSGAVQLISLNSSTSPPAIYFKNNFTIPDPAPAVLVYSTGSIEIKNSAESNGAVYAGAISIKNNLEVTYDPRVERSLGFGPEKFSRVSWEELST